MAELFDQWTLPTGNCDGQLGFLECGDGSCYRQLEVCDGRAHCLNGADEADCEHPLALSHVHTYMCICIQYIHIYTHTRVRTQKPLHSNICVHTYKDRKEKIYIFH